MRRYARARTDIPAVMINHEFSTRANVVLGLVGIISLVLLLLWFTRAVDDVVREAVGEAASLRRGADLLTQCSQAQDLLGEGAFHTELQNAKGMQTVEGDWGNAKWKVPVEGSRNRGVLHLSAEMHSGNWIYGRVDLTVGNRELDIAECLKAQEKLALVDLDPTALLATCDSGDALACHLLAERHSIGDGVAEDLLRALTYYQRGCEGGELRSCASVGIILAEGRGVPADPTRAIPFLVSACDSKIEKGCKALDKLRSH